MKSAMSEKTINSKSIAFVSMMSAIGTILALLSLYLVPLVGQQVALDLSHIGTYIVALSGGPLLGLITGALVGFLPSYRFANPAIIPGKMMTGIFIGLFYGLFQKITAVREKKYLTVIAIIVSGLCGYIPESIFTWWDLKYIVGLPDFYVIPIIIKAWVEIIVITVLMAIILNINYIKSQLSHLIGDQIKLSVYDYLLSAIITIPIFSITFYFASLNQLIPIDIWNLKPDVFLMILWISLSVELGLIITMVVYYFFTKHK